MLSNVTAKGQVTIPAEVRSRFNILPNDRVDIIVDGERIVIMPVKTLKQLRGVVPPLDADARAQERAVAKQALAERVSGESA